MKNKIILSATVIALIFSACNDSSVKKESTNSVNATSAKEESTTQIFNLDTTKLKTGAKYYQCEMNPDVISDKPGTCPKCGMDMTEIKKR